VTAKRVEMHDTRDQTQIIGWCYGHDRRACILRTRPSCILHRSTIDTMLQTRPPQDGDTHQPNYYH